MSDAAGQVHAQVLIVEDEPDHAEVMAEALKKPGHVCTIVHGVRAALDELAGGAFDVIVTDLRMPESAGVEGVDDDGGNAGMIVLQRALGLQRDAATVMVTAHGDVATTREAFKHGVFDFIEKPIDLEIFRELVNRAAEKVLLRHEAVREGLEELVSRDGFDGIVAGSEQMRRILDTVVKVAATPFPVLVTGESGTGKELIARAIHDHSPRKGKRFVPVNCAGQSESLLEDELFGHMRGAFTGADKERQGLFEFADGGTLFLDEVGDMPISMQAKVLRALESGEVVRLGSNDPKNVDVRFVCATNKDLAKAVNDGGFRQDLYFRINGTQIHIPPLRERRDDVPRLVRHAVAKAVQDISGPDAPVPGVSDAAMMRLAGYAWPGNVRELLNVVRNVVTMTQSGVKVGDKAPAIDAADVPDHIRSGEDSDVGVASPTGGTGSLAGTSLRELEKRAIRETLKLTAGNRERAANLLGIGERTLYRKLKEYGLR